MKKIWMNTVDALRPTSGKHAARRAPRSSWHVPDEHRMTDRHRPALSTR